MKLFFSPPPAQRVAGRGRGSGVLRHTRCQRDSRSHPPPPTPPHRFAEGGAKSAPATLKPTTVRGAHRDPPTWLPRRRITPSAPIRPTSYSGRRHTKLLLLPSIRARSAWRGGVGGGGASAYSLSEGLAEPPPTPLHCFAEGGAKSAPATELAIRFKLRDIEKIALWEEPGKRSLHRFGLTDGGYCIDQCQKGKFFATQLRRPQWTVQRPIA
jgi:hypothetical protein